MSDKRKIEARFSDGQVIRRSTTKALTHAWAFKIRRDDEKVIGNSGFASSHDLATRALAAESTYTIKNAGGAITFSEIVEVTAA